MSDPAPADAPPSPAPRGRLQSVPASRTLARMPPSPHREQHFTASETVRDIVIGLSDGLTVPFALAAGLTGAISQSRLIVTAGFAEIAAGSIAMGLGGYLAARGDAEHFAQEQRREEREIVSLPEMEPAGGQAIFQPSGPPRDESAPVVASLRRRPKDGAASMMRFEPAPEQPQPGRAWKSAPTTATAYIVGGLVPLSAYLLVNDSN